MRDITERKAADEALRASEAQYRAIFNASADALVLWNSALRRVDINPAYERIFGYSREEVLGSHYRQDLPGGYVERRLELVRRTLAGRTAPDSIGQSAGDHTACKASGYHDECKK